VVEVLSENPGYSKQVADTRLAAKPRVFQGALAVSLAIHMLPVAAVAVFGHLAAKTEAENTQIVYSVRLEKAGASIDLARRQNAQARREKSKSAGESAYELDGEHKVLRASYESILASKIQKNRYYPRQAINLGQEGQPVVRIVLNTSGHITQVLVEESSGSAILDAAAIDIVRRAGPFPPPPKEYLSILSKRGDQQMVFKAPISFDITRARL